MNDDDREPPTPPIQKAPLYLDGRELTDPHTLLTEDVSPEVQRLLELSTRPAGQATPWIATLKILESFDRFKHDTVKAIAEAADPARVKRIERTWKSVKKYAWTALLAVGTSLGGAVVAALRAADAHGVDSQRMIQHEKDIDRLDRQIDQLRDLCARLGQRSSLAPDFPVALVRPDQKGHP